MLRSPVFSSLPEGTFGSELDLIHRALICNKRGQQQAELLEHYNRSLGLTGSGNKAVDWRGIQTIMDHRMHAQKLLSILTAMAIPTLNC